MKRKKKKKIKENKKNRTINLVLQILKNKHILNNKRIGLAVSGGIDSMVMLALFNNIRSEKKIDLYVLHYNHKWREKSSLDAKLIREYCKKYKIKFLRKAAEGEIIQEEEIARNQRYLFFKSCAKRYKLDLICTAHHLDDQAETVLFRLARGTGPKGMLPIKETLELSDGIKIFRPFLGVTKQQLSEYAVSNKVPYIEDETNQQLKYKRNLIRHRLIPILKEINENAINNILLCSDLIYSQNCLLDNYFSGVLKRISKRTSLSWQRKKFLKLNPYLQKAFIYWFLSLQGLKGGISKIETIRKAIKEKNKIDLDKNCMLVCDKFLINFLKKENKEVKIKNAKLNIAFSLNGKRKEIRLTHDAIFSVESFTSKHFKKDFPKDREKIAYVDFAGYRNKNLCIRYRKSKDIFNPLGFSNTLKLKKYLINKKIPKENRYNLPLLCSKNEILWIPGYSLSEKVKVNDKPTHILEIRSTK